MKICEVDHDEIVYDQRDCPLCVMKEKLEESANKISDLEDDIEQLEKDVASLEDEVDDYKEKALEESER